MSLPLHTRDDLTLALFLNFLFGGGYRCAPTQERKFLKNCYYYLTIEIETTVTKEKKEALKVFLEQAKGLFEPSIDMAIMSDAPEDVKKLQDIVHLHDKAIAELDKKRTNTALFDAIMDKIQEQIEKLKK